MKRLALRVRARARPKLGEADDDAPVVGHVLLDDEDYERLSGMKWRLRPGGHVVTGKSTLIQRVVLDAPDDRRMVVVHVNGDKLDNRRANLALVTKAQAMRLQSSIGRPREQEYEIDAETGCWMWRESSRHRTGYGLVVRDGKTWRAHRWVWTERRGPIPEGHDLHHECGRRACVNPDHLRLVTRAEHAMIDGRRTLTAEAVLALRDGSLSVREAMERFGVTYTTAWQAKSGRSWKALARPS